MNFLTASLVVITAFTPTSVLASPARRATVDTFPVPGDSAFPKGVVFQNGSELFYTSSSQDGKVYRGSLSSAILEPFVDGLPAGMVSPMGMKIHKDHLYIAGGASGMLFDFSVSNRMILRRYYNGDPTSSLSDLAVDPETGDVYVTDAYHPTIWKASIASDNKITDQKLTKWADLKGKIKFQSSGSNVNGVVMTPDRKCLIVGDKNDKALYRIRMSDKKVDKISITGGAVSFFFFQLFPQMVGDQVLGPAANEGVMVIAQIGGPDGLLYDAPHLFSVNGESIDVIEIDEGYSKGKVVGQIKSSLLLKPGMADFLVGGKEMLVSNFQGGAEKPKLPFTVVRIPVKW